MRRLPPRPGERIERGRELSFSFDGKPAHGLAGDTVASAVAAGGRRVFSRSFKYHRPRGLMCCSGQCPNCLVSVDGAPGVRACTEPLREGMEVEHLNAWPGLDRDAMRVVDVAGGPFTSPGFYYKTFMRPRRLWPLYEKVLRHAAGLGSLRTRPRERELPADHRTRHCDVLVAGGGEAGLHAAIAAAEAGADVVLADEGPAPGGRMLWEGRHEEAAALAERAAGLGVEVIAGSALGYFDGLVPVASGSLLHRVRAEQVVVATGALPQPLAFGGNDLPGVMLAEGALRLAELYAVAPGTRAVVATTGEEGHEAAAALAAAGLSVAAIVDSREGASGAAPSGPEPLAGHAVVRAHGRGGVTAAEVAPLGPDGRPAGRTRRIDCDLIAVAGGRTPAGSLLLQAGARSAYDDGGGCFVPSDAPPGLHAAGAVTGAGADAAASGAAAGRAAATGERHAIVKGSDPLTIPVVGEGESRCFVCLCEDVTEKDVKAAVAEGFDSIELAKRYLTVTMGPCQGRMCQLASARSIARETGETLAEVGTTTARPPWSSVPLGLLAGRQHEPAFHSALEPVHRRLGARIEWAGSWRRAFDYGDPSAEALHVHRSAGLIDVSPLGKLIVQGPDAAEFLDRVYPNRLSTLDAMRVRYGVLLTEAGRIMDDGTVCRLDDETFYVTTTTGGSQAVVRWLRWWLADWQYDVRISDVTGALAAVNLAGPRARDVLGPHTDLDLDGEAFPYLHARVGTVAGARALVMRIGFVGELGYEIHFPCVHAPHLWETLLADDVRPFGLEAQRLLRLEKMHLIVGHDTDTESNPFDAGMPWIVKLDKEHDFLGRWWLEHTNGGNGRERLVGFTADADDAPEEGSAVVIDGHPAGRVTSCRVSGALGRAVGIAWVPPALAEEGSEVRFASNGRTLSGTVSSGPFYDPDGERMRA
jgi:sarcosine oxidase, subunit alpha